MWEEGRGEGKEKRQMVDSTEHYFYRKEEEDLRDLFQNPFLELLEQKRMGNECKCAKKKILDRDQLRSRGVMTRHSPPLTDKG